MDYMISVPNKRRHGDLEDFHQAKKVCNGLGSCGQVEYGAVAESPMDTRDSLQQGLQNCNSLRNHRDQNMVCAASQAGVYPQMCPRCMAGESTKILGASQYSSLPTTTTRKYVEERSREQNWGSESASQSSKSPSTIDEVALSTLTDAEPTNIPKANHRSSTWVTLTI